MKLPKRRLSTVRSCSSRTMEAVPSRPRVDVVVGGKFGFHAGFARNGSDNDRRAVFVPDIILNDHDRAVALLLRADAPAQIGVIHIAAQICVAHSVMTSFVYLGVSAYVEVKRQNRIKVGERLNTLRFI